MRPRMSVPIGTLVVLVVLGAGCLGVVAGDEPLVVAASEAAVEPSALDATDFRAADARSAWLNETVEVAGQEREVRVRNYAASYELSPTLGSDGTVSFGAFSVFSTPRVSVAGQGLNPLGRLSHRKMVDRVADRTGGLSDVQRTDTRELTVLDTSTTVTRFSATVERSGREVPVTVEVTRVEHGEDYVVAVGVSPRGDGDVRGQVETLFMGIDH